ncbi:MAG: enoyl-CoA hydratase, partial [Deltaproteobacteria bacterium]|nr:enoyl-CoA hydratase [Deltaproteobacteria bacterium]
LLTGRYYSAHEAKELGLINRVVPVDDLAFETEKLAGQIAEASGFALRVGKQGFYAQVDQADSNAMHFAKNTIAMNCTAEDAQNGMKAFLKKEIPEWKDR